MAAQIGSYKLLYLVKFDSPDGSTYWGLKNYNILVNFENPDGSTIWGYINYSSSDIFDSPDGRTYWELILTIQMAAQTGVTHVIIF